MNSYIEHQNSNRNKHKHLFSKLDKLNLIINDDIKILKELITLLPNKLDNNDLKKLGKTLENLETRIKLYDSKIDKYGYHIDEFKTSNMKLVKTMETFKTSNDPSQLSLVTEISSQYNDLENLLLSARENLKLLEEILLELKNAKNIDFERDRLDNKITELLDNKLKDLPTEDFVLYKIKEHMSCYDGRCEIMESSLKEVANQLETYLLKLEERVDQLENTIMYFKEESNKRLNEVSELDDMMKDEIDKVKENFHEKLNQIKALFEANIIRY